MATRSSNAGCKARDSSPARSEASCGVCGEEYQDETEVVENWIACDECNTWFHWSCLDISKEPESFVCAWCS